MELKRKDVVKAAKEFNAVVILDEHPVKDLKSVDLEKNLFDALKFIEEGDNFSDTTDSVFNELKIKFTPKPVVKSKKSKTVEVGTTVELDVSTSKIKNDKGMKKSKNGADNAQIVAAKIVCSKTAKKADLMALLDSDGLYTKKQKKTFLAVTNFLSLKKQMKEALEPDVVAKVETDMKAAPKSKAKPKVKLNPLAKEIKEAIKVKQLKKIAKANDQFDWKALKKLDFEEMQKAMLNGSKPMAKVKMIANPLIAEIEGIKKLKKLRKFAKKNEKHFPAVVTKKLKTRISLATHLINLLPSEIEAGSGERIVVNHIDQEARKARLIGLIEKGKSTRPELMVILKEEFPEEGKAHTNSNILSECKNPNRWEKFGNFGGLVETDAEGHYRFADTKTKKKKSGKKDKKGKKSKK